MISSDEDSFTYGSKPLELTLGTLETDIKSNIIKTKYNAKLW
jgi:hypothetical protein